MRTVDSDIHADELAALPRFAVRVLVKEGTGGTTSEFVHEAARRVVKHVHVIYFHAFAGHEAKRLCRLLALALGRDSDRFWGAIVCSLRSIFEHCRGHAGARTTHAAVVT